MGSTSQELTPIKEGLFPLKRFSFILVHEV